MDNSKIKNSVNQFLTPTSVKKLNNNEREECDLITGECYVVREKDGIVERINKKYVTEDGRQLLQD
jgi:hypothetical protein